MPIAIFTTSEIFQLDTLEGGEEVKAVLPDGTKCYTTGWLEEALKQGYEVYVVTSRAKLDKHDYWWKALVSKGHIIMGDWSKLYRDLDLVQPDDMTHWTNQRWYLKTLGFKLGHDFEVKPSLSMTYAKRTKE